jgi:hypothetical protein
MVSENSSRTAQSISCSRTSCDKYPFTFDFARPRLTYDLPDLTLGGLTELIKVAAMAAAYDIPVVPHGSGPYSFQAIMTFPNSSFCEYIVSPRGFAKHPELIHAY